MTPVTYIAADNIISPLGFTTGENFAQLKNGATGVSYLPVSDLSTDPIFAGLIDKSKLEQAFASINTSVEYTVLEQMAVLSIADCLAQNSKIKASSPGTLFILSTTKGNIDLINTSKTTGFNDKRKFLWEAANVIAQHFGNPNKPIVVSNACISGVVGLITAKRMIEDRLYDTIVVCGVDVLSQFVVSGFQSFKAVSNSIARPFDASRDGISLGEACGTIVVTSNPECAKVPDKIVITGGSSANDANHISGPSRTGDGLLLAIENTLKEAFAAPADISFISGHGTATIFNDEMESFALTRAGLAQVPVNSLKSYYGHTLGAAGIVESVVSLQSMRENYLIGTFNYSSLGVSNLINVIASSYSASVSNCLKTAAGFGGCNAAILFQKQ